MEKLQKAQNVFTVIIAISLIYLFYQNIKLKREVVFDKKIIEAHQYSLDLKEKQIQDLHRIALDIIEARGLNINNEITLDPYKN